MFSIGWISMPAETLQRLSAPAAVPQARRGERLFAFVLAMAVATAAAALALQ